MEELKKVMENLLTQMANMPEEKLDFMINCMNWCGDNQKAAKALIDGEACVVPAQEKYFTKFLTEIRLDQPSRESETK